MPHPAVDSKSRQARPQGVSGPHPEKKFAYPPLMLTPAGVAHELSLSRYTIYELLRSGQLRGRRFGRITLVPREEVERFAASLEQK